MILFLNLLWHLILILYYNVAKSYHVFYLSNLDVTEGCVLALGQGLDHHEGWFSSMCCSTSEIFPLHSSRGKVGESLHPQVGVLAARDGEW